METMKFRTIEYCYYVCYYNGTLEDDDLGVIQGDPCNFSGGSGHHKKAVTSLGKKDCYQTEPINKTNRR